MEFIGINVHGSIPLHMKIPDLSIKLPKVPFWVSNGKRDSRRIHDFCTTNIGLDTLIGTYPHSIVQFRAASFLACRPYHVVDVLCVSAKLNAPCRPLLPALSMQAWRSNSFQILIVTMASHSTQQWFSVANYPSHVNKERGCCLTTGTHPCHCFLPTFSASTRPT